MSASDGSGSDGSGSIVKRLTPAVPRRWLLAVAAAVWAGVGVMLGVRAAGWLGHEPWRNVLPLAAAGAAFGVTMYGAVFRRLARRNSDRITAADERVCIFGFQSVRGYVVTVSMIVLGVALRHSPLPKPYLAVAYAGIGLGLVLASFGYISRFAGVGARR